MMLPTHTDKKLTKKRDLNIPAVLTVLSDVQKKHYELLRSDSGQRSGLNSVLLHWEEFADYLQAKAATVVKCPTSLRPSDTSTAGFPTTIPLKGEATTRQQRRNQQDFCHSYTCRHARKE